MNKHQREFAIVEGQPALSTQQLEAKLIAAYQAHRHGDLLAASEGYRSVLHVDPRQPDALHLLGVVAHQLGDQEAAVDLIGRAVELAPSNSEAHSNLGNALHALRRCGEAEVAYRKAVQVNPQNPAALFNLGNVLTESAKDEEAIECYDRAAELDPSNPNLLFNRAGAFFRLGEFERALADYEKIRDMEPERSSLHTNIGSALAALQRWDEAESVLSDAVRRNESDPLAHSNLGNIFQRTGRYKEAIQSLEKAHQLDRENIEIRFGLARAWMHKDPMRSVAIAEATTRRPDARARDWYLLGAAQTSVCANSAAIRAFEIAAQMDPESVYESNHLGVAYMQEGRLDRAIDFFSEVIRRDPENDIAYNELGIAFKDCGDIPKAIETMRKGLEIRPNADCHSNMLFTQFYSSDFTPQDILSEARGWAAAHAPAGAQKPTVRSRKGRKLRIGYLSADFHAHPAGYIYEALLPLHDPARVDVFIYANQVVGDDVSVKIFSNAKNWLIVKNYTDEDLAERIRKDEIDVFVDLLGHTNSHRLGVFGMKPAPVQASWLGYFGTTGMEQMDYIVCDRWTLPESEEPNYTERPARMPGSMYVYRTPDLALEPGEPPCIRNGYTTFGCFNNTAKITPETLSLWARAMKTVPDSRLILNRWPFRTEMVRERFYGLLEAEGIDRGRVDIRATKGREAYFEVYNEVDIVLDTFPYGGGTTTSEALWMGVPVVSVPADRLVGHMTESIYQSVGLTELCIASEDQFVELASSLAADRDRLSHFRRTLRHRLECSSLCDLALFARELENLYEWMYDEAAGRLAA